MVCKNQQTLFIGIDEYDTPTNSIVFNSRSTLEPSTSLLVKVSAVQIIFKAQFFSILREGACLRGKDNKPVLSMNLTLGVIPAFCTGISPLGSSEIVSDLLQLHGMCRLTEDEVQW